MEKKQLSKKLLLFMGIKLLLILLFLSNSSCKREEDAWNEVKVINTTNDTLVLNLTKKYISDFGEKNTLYPDSEFLMARALYTSGFGIIEDDFGDSRDTIEIYRNDSLFVKWGGPLISLPDSVHSFYNKNSWTTSRGGNKNKYEIIEFAIYESDLKHD
jgi:hypothetical protein